MLEWLGGKLGWQQGLWGRRFISCGGRSGEVNNGISAGFEEISWSDFVIIGVLAENEEILS